MENETMTVFSHGLNKVFRLKFPESYQLWQKIPEEGWRVQQSKHCWYNNHDEENNLDHVNTVRVNRYYCLILAQVTDGRTKKQTGKATIFMTGRAFMYNSLYVQ